MIAIVANHVQNVRSSPSFGSYMNAESVTVARDDAWLHVIVDQIVESDRILSNLTHQFIDIHHIFNSEGEGVQRLDLKTTCIYTWYILHPTPNVRGPAWVHGHKRTRDLRCRLKYLKNFLSKCPCKTFLSQHIFLIVSKCWEKNYL